MTSAPAIIDTRFGPLQADLDQAVLMVDPLPGFETCRRYVVVSSPELEPFTCLQGLDEPRPSFLAIDPRLVEPAFRMSMSNDERRRLDAVADEPLLWMALVRVDEDGVASVNLRAPVVVNSRRMIGIQLMGADSPYAIDHPLTVD